MLKTLKIKTLKIKTLNKLFLFCILLFLSSCSVYQFGSSSSNKKNLPKVSSKKFKKYYKKFSLPLKNYTFTSDFNYRNNYFHEGIDLAASIGTPVYAAFSGTVVHADFFKTGYGKTVVIRKDDIMSVYAHNNEIVVLKGDSVKQGDLISYVGMTGKTSGPHVHFEIRVKTKHGFRAVDPAFFLKENYK